MNRHVHDGARHRRRGAALVEFALILPLLMLLLVGSIEMGRAISVRHTLAEAARTGARAFSMRKLKDEQDIRDVVDTIMAEAKLKGYTVTLDPDPASDIQQLDPVTVTVSIAAKDASWYPTPWILKDSDVVSARCVMPADLGETAADGIAAGVSTTDLEKDADELAELSGSQDPQVQALEAEAQKLAEEAKRLRVEADAALQAYNDHLAKGRTLDPDSDAYEDWEEASPRYKQAAVDADAAATQAELDAEAALAAANKAAANSP